MRVLVQWTLADPSDWVEVSISDVRGWRGLAKKAEPQGGESIDNAPGWIYGVNVQGVVISAFDHYSAAPVVDATYGVGLRVIGWSDDPEDWTPIERHALVWDFFTPRHDARVGGTNTAQRLTVYTDDPRLVELYSNVETTIGPVLVRPWSAFSAPRENDTRHGIWTSDPLSDAHVARRSRRGWREWIGDG